MSVIMTLWQQLSSLCFFLQNNTKLKVHLALDCNEIFISISDNNEKPIYTASVSGLFVKNEKVIEFELKQIINYLIELKDLKLELTKIK